MVARPCRFKSCLQHFYLWRLLCMGNPVKAFEQALRAQRVAGAPSEDLARARQLGVAAFLAGAKAIPAYDVALNNGLIREYSGDVMATNKILEAWLAGWTAANLENTEETDLAAQPQADSARVQEGIERLFDSARKAQTAFNAGNDKRMFFALLGVIDALGVIGRAYDVENVGYLGRVWKSFAKLSGGRPTTNF